MNIEMELKYVQMLQLENKFMTSWRQPLADFQQICGQMTIIFYHLVHTTHSHILWQNLANSLKGKDIYSKIYQRKGLIEHLSLKFTLFQRCM